MKATESPDSGFRRNDGGIIDSPGDSLSDTLRDTLSR